LLVDLDIVDISLLFTITGSPDVFVNLMNLLMAFIEP